MLKKLEELLLSYRSVSFKIVNNHDGMDGSTSFGFVILDPYGEELYGVGWYYDIDEMFKDLTESLKLGWRYHLDQKEKTGKVWRG